MKNAGGIWSSVEAGHLSCISHCYSQRKMLVNFFTVNALTVMLPGIKTVLKTNDTGKVGEKNVNRYCVGEKSTAAGALGEDES